MQALEIIRVLDKTGAFALVATDAILAAQAWEEKSSGGIGAGVDASEFIGRLTALRTACMPIWRLG